MNWGILGCGNIARAMGAGLQHCEGAHLAAVAARNLNRAQAFAQEYHATRAYGSYEELVADPEVDVVYIATTHNFHAEQMRLCLEHDKHVLCEKPLTINESQAQAIFNLARERQRFVMEAVWSRFLPGFVKIREWLRTGRLGEVLYVHAEFGFAADYDPNGRLFNRALAGGSLLDVGIYPITLAKIAFGEYPAQIQSTLHIGETGVDEHGAYLLEFSKRRTATLGGSFRFDQSRIATICGTEGILQFDNFFHPTELKLFPKRGKAEVHPVPYESSGFQFEAAETMRCIQEGRLESRVMPWQETLEMMRIMDTIRDQAQFKYPEE